MTNHIIALCVWSITSKPPKKNKGPWEEERIRRTKNESNTYREWWKNGIQEENSIERNERETRCMEIDIQMK